MGTALALIEPTQFDVIEKLATIAYKSGLTKYEGEKGYNQIQFIMMKGVELGIQPMAALAGIDVIKGAPTVKPALMIGLIQRTGELTDIKIESAKDQCSVTMKRGQQSPHTEIFTMENAKGLELTNKYNWKQQPAVMLKWRAVSACARVVFADVVQGLYTHEEIDTDAKFDEAGEYITVEPELHIEPKPETPTAPQVVEEPNVEEPQSEPETTNKNDAWPWPDDYVTGEGIVMNRILKLDGVTVQPHARNIINLLGRAKLFGKDMSLDDIMDVVRNREELLADADKTQKSELWLTDELVETLFLEYKLAEVYQTIPLLNVALETLAFAGAINRKTKLATIGKRVREFQLKHALQAGE